MRTTKVRESLSFLSRLSLGLGFAWASALFWSYSAHAEQSALEGKIQRALGRLAPQVETLTEPNASLRGELEQLLEDGRGLYQLPLSTLTWKGETRSATRVVLELVDQYAQATSDPVLNARSRGYLKALKEKALFHPEKIQYETLREEAFPYLVGDAGLEVAALASKTLFEKATEEDTYNEEMLDQALTLLNSAFSLADGRTGTKEYFESTYLVLSALQDEKALQSLTRLLRAREAKDPARFAWVSDFFSKQENSLEHLLKEAFLKKEEIDLALLTLDAPNSECEGVDVFESSHGQAILKALKEGDTSQKGVALSLLAKKSETEILDIFQHPQAENLELSTLSESFLLYPNDSILVLKALFKSDRSQFRKEAIQAIGSMRYGVSSLVRRSLSEKRDLIVLLQDPEKKVRYAAAIALIQFNRSSSAAYTFLYAALKDEENEDPFSAALALAYSYASDLAPAIPFLIEGLGSPSAEIRLQAVEGIYEIGREASIAVPKLIEMLKDPDQGIRLAAIGALSRMYELSFPAVPELIKLLGDTDASIREQAAYALGHIGEASTPAIPLLISKLQDKESTVRERAANALGRIGERSEVVLVALIEALKDPIPEVRSSVALSLGKLKATTGVPSLIVVLNDQDAHVRSFAALALGKIAEKAEVIVPALIESLRDSDELVRSYAVRSLGQIGKEAVSSISELMHMYSVEGNAVRWDIVLALGSIGMEAELVVPFLVEVLKSNPGQFQREAIESLGKFGDQAVSAVPAILQTLKDPTVDPKPALDALGEIGDVSPPTVYALINFLGYRQDSSRTLVVDLLEKLGSKTPGAREIIINALANALTEDLETSDDVILEYFIKAIRQFEEKAVSALPVLVKISEMGNSYISECAISAIGDLGKDSKSAVPNLLKALKSSDEWIGSRAAQSLGRIGEEAEQVVPALIEALQGIGPLPVEAALAFGTFGEKAEAAVPELQRLLRGSNSTYQQVAAISLGRMGKVSSSAIPLIIQAFRHEDENRKRNAVEALIKIGSPALIPLSYELRDPNPEVRKLAGEAIRRIHQALEAKEKEEKK